MDTFTPEELAWKMIMDEHIPSSAIVAFSDDNSIESLFEILITIYLEMLFNHYKMQYLQQFVNLTDDDNDDINYDIEEKLNEFKLDLTHTNLSSLTDIFCKKFNIINYILNIHEIEKEDYDYSKKYRYCSILLKDSPLDNLYFIINADILDPDKRYHFVLNSLYIKKDKLKDICCTINIHNKYYKISFDILKTI